MFKGSPPSADRHVEAGQDPAVCSSHWSPEHDFKGESLPRGWLNTIAFPSSKPQVCAAKHATRQWELAAWMMVITAAAEAANASLQEGAYGEHL